jgi:hypothetical protein
MYRGSKNRKWKDLIGMLSLTFVLLGCAEKWEPKPLTVTRMIAGAEKKVWKFSSIEIIDEGETDGEPITARDLFLPCARDNEYVFYNNEEKTYEYTSGTIKCSPTESNILIEHVWSYTTANATFEFALPLALFGDIYILPFTVKKLTETEMVLEVYFSKVYVDETDASFRLVLRSDNN